MRPHCVSRPDAQNGSLRAVYSMFRRRVKPVVAASLTARPGPGPDPPAADHFTLYTSPLPRTRKTVVYPAIQRE